MLKKFSKKQSVIILVIVAFIPIIIASYEIIFTTNKAVIFLGNYNPKISMLVISYYLFLFALAIYWFITQLISITQLKNEKAKTELALLKSQINPHFFFNMLNNLYGLIGKDSRKAQELVLKLSDVMRYSIYEGDREVVSLEEEINYLNNYIQLHKMRYHKNIAINFNYDIDQDLKVIPLLFIMLLENSFKHGVENLTEGAFINLNLYLYNDKINFTIENNYANTKNNNNKSGIGLENLRHRLELTYPNMHQLSFSITDNHYKVQLILNQL